MKPWIRDLYFQIYKNNRNIKKLYFYDNRIGPKWKGFDDIYIGIIYTDIQKAIDNGQMD